MALVNPRSAIFGLIRTKVGKICAATIRYHLSIKTFSHSTVFFYMDPLTNGQGPRRSLGPNLGDNLVTIGAHINLWGGT